jgi:hypothetical protein
LKDGKRIHEPDPHTWRVIKEMFELFLREGESAVTVTKEMARRGIVTRGGRPYQHSKVVKMLGSKYYIGIIEFSGKEYPGNQETFISKDLFERVQNKLHGNRPSVYKRHNPLFKNMITCGLCGGVVTWQLQKGRYYGACQRLSEACKGRKTIREDRLEEDIKRMLKNLVSPKPEVVDWAMNELKARDESSSLSAKESIKDIEEQIERFSRMDSRLYDDKLAGDISREQFGEMCGVQGRSVKLWEMRSGVPADVSEMILNLEAKVRADSEDALKRLTGRSDVVLMRGPDPLKNAANNRVFVALRAIGQDARIVAFDYKAYRKQLRGPDTPEARQAWARRAVKEQAKPHKQDQPA